MLSKETNLIASGTIIQAESVPCSGRLLFWSVPSQECLCMWKVVSLCRVCFVLCPICPEWQLGFIWKTSPLYSISSCLCSGLCVSPSHWLGCIMWLMSSGQSAVGTRTCSGDPEADWRPANGEDTVTSEAVRCQTGLLIMHPDTRLPLEAACHRLRGV